MKKQVLILCCFLFSTGLLAQPIINYPANAPAIGDITEIQFVSPDGISHLPAGPDVTWDYSQLNNLQGGSIVAIDPASAPAGAMFPAANIALMMNDSTYTYGLVENDGFYYLGAQLSFSGMPVTMVYSDSRQYMKYPFTYLDTYSDSYEGVSSVLVTEVRSSGESVVMADSYGTIILPNGTYNDVLRISTADVEIDSIFMKGVFLSAVMTTRAQFHWFAPTSVSPLFSIEIIEAAGSTDTVVYYSTTGSGVYEPAKNALSDLRVFPNPADDHLSIEFTAQANDEVSITIVNQLGQQMHSSNPLSNNGMKYSEMIDISDFPPGIYLANVSCKCGSQRTERFVIR